MNHIVDVNKKVDDGTDLRTRQGRESEVLQKIQQDRGFSIFWATENLNRAAAIERLRIRGEIVSTGGEYPWCGFKIKGEP